MQPLVAEMLMIKSTFSVLRDDVVSNRPTAVLRGLLASETKLELLL